MFKLNFQISTKLITLDLFLEEITSISEEFVNRFDYIS